MNQVRVVTDWDSAVFHGRILELENEGWVSVRESYKVTAEMNPETGFVSHVHSIELVRA